MMNTTGFYSTMQTDVYLPQRRKYKDFIFLAPFMVICQTGNITNSSADRLCFSRDVILNLLALYFLKLVRKANFRRK